MKLTINCLAFANDLAIYSDSIETAAREISQLKTQLPKAGLQIAFKKTQLVTNMKPSPKELRHQGQLKQ